MGVQNSAFLMSNTGIGGTVLEAFSQNGTMWHQMKNDDIHLDDLSGARLFGFVVV